MTTLSEEVAEVVRGLTKAQRAALSCPPSWGLPLGHNQWFDLAYFTSTDPEQFICNGEDMDAVVRLGLVAVGDRDDDNGAHLIDDERDVEARWKLDLTPLGLAVRTALTASAGGE